MEKGAITTVNNCGSEIKLHALTKLMLINIIYKEVENIYMQNSAAGV